MKTLQPPPAATIPVAFPAGPVRVEAQVRADRARRIEALSQKLAGQLSREDRQRLFQGPDLESIRFEEKVQTVLYAEAGNSGNWSERERDSFTAEVEWLATRHQGIVDRFVQGAAAICFNEPGPCVRMAMDLQRSAAELHLRMGIHTGICDVGIFRSGHQACCTLIGPETGLAARVAASAATGSIAISPDTYALAKDGIHVDAAGCLLIEEFQDSDLAQVCLMPTPAKGGPAMSTFAGLGPAT